MGLEADKVELLLLELLYKTDYSNEFDREVRATTAPSSHLTPLACQRGPACVLTCLPVPPGARTSVCAGVHRLFPAPGPHPLPGGVSHRA